MAKWQVTDLLWNFIPVHFSPPHHKPTSNGPVVQSDLPLNTIRAALAISNCMWLQDGDTDTACSLPPWIIIMYIYDALINALSAGMIHVNLNMIFYTRVEHSPTKTLCIKYYTEKQTHAPHTYNDCSRKWVQILAGMKILWEEEGFLFGFKRWQGWAVSKCLRKS